jgi:hypothetical protein
LLTQFKSHLGIRIKQMVPDLTTHGKNWIFRDEYCWILSTSSVVCSIPPINVFVVVVIIIKRKSLEVLNGNPT